MSNKILIPKGAAGTKIAKAAKKVIEKVSTKAAPIEDVTKKVDETVKTAESEIAKPKKPLGLNRVKAKKPTPLVTGPDTGVIKANDSLVEYVEKVGKKTNDDRIKILGNALKTQELPKEFVKYVESIFKQTSKVAHLNSKTVTTRKYIDAPEEIVNFKGKEIVRPTFDKVYKEKKTIHDEEYGRDVLRFSKKKRKSEEELKELDLKLDEALKYLDDIEKGEFKVTKSMLKEIYSKSVGQAVRYTDTKEHTDLIRKLFSRIELPKVIKNQSSKDYSGLVSPSEELSRFYEHSDANVEWWKKVMEQAEKWKREHDYFGEIVIKPIVVTPKRKKGVVYHYTDDGQVAFGTRDPYPGEPPKRIYLTHTMSEQTPSFVVGHRAYIRGYNGKEYRIPGMPKYPFEQHHNTELALLEAEAYIKNPRPKTKYEHLLDYLKVKKEHEKSGKRFVDNFLALEKEYHTGKNGIHNFNPFTPQDLTRIKDLARSGSFESLDELLNFYKDIKSSQKSLFENLLKARDSLHRNGGKLDLIKQFKRGGLIDSLNKPQTWEEYQKLNRQK